MTEHLANLPAGSTALEASRDDEGSVFILVPDVESLSPEDLRPSRRRSSAAADTVEGIGPDELVRAERPAH